MRKYTPSPKNNVEARDELLKEVNAVVYNIGKGKYNKELPSELVSNAVNDIKIELEMLENSVGTGKEDLTPVINNLKNSNAALKKEAGGEFQSRFRAAADDLCIAISTFRDVLTGEIDGLEAVESKKASWKIAKLEEKIKEVENVKFEFQKNERRLEGEIQLIEKDVQELESKMIESDNERVLNDLYRRISSSKSKINTLNVRRTNYSACFSILDIIESNAREIVVAGEFAPYEIGVAKALLNMERIKNTVSDPESAVPILRVMEKNIKDISDKVATADKKIFGMATPQNEINNDALQYKEELLKKKREKEDFARKQSEIDNAFINKDEIKVESKGE